MGMRILYRQVFDISPDRLSEFMEKEDNLLAIESEKHWPDARKYRPMAVYTDCGSRIYERVFDSYLDFARLVSARQLDRDLANVDASRFALMRTVRNELYYVDSGSPIPHWMKAVSSDKVSDELLETGLPWSSSYICKKQEGEIAVMYRQIQCVPKECWAGKLEQEMKSDRAELSQGNPLPIRLRTMYALGQSHLRVSEREYPSYKTLCQIHENFINESSAEDSAVMDAEASRQAYFTWEKEELYYVD